MTGACHPTDLILLCKESKTIHITTIWSCLRLAAPQALQRCLGAQLFVYARRDQAMGSSSPSMSATYRSPLRLSTYSPSKDRAPVCSGPFEHDLVSSLAHSLWTRNLYTECKQKAHDHLSAPRSCLLSAVTHLAPETSRLTRPYRLILGEKVDFHVLCPLPNSTILPAIGVSHNHFLSLRLCCFGYHRVLVS